MISQHSKSNITKNSEKHGKQAKIVKNTENRQKSVKLNGFGEVCEKLLSDLNVPFSVTAAMFFNR